MKCYKQGNNTATREVEDSDLLGC